MKCTLNIEKSKKNSLNILYSNVDILSNKINELEHYAKIYETDIILITEHLPKNSLKNVGNIFNIPGFSCIEDCSGRGVCVFYKDNIDIENHNYINELYHPSLFFKIKTPEKSLNFGLVYRSPNNDPVENKKLNNQLNFASKKLKNLIVFGDFNHPHIDWEFNSCNKYENHPDSLFLFEMLKIRTNQLINKTTHHKPLCKPSLIDLIITKEPDLVTNIKHNPPIGNSHHDTITAVINTDFVLKTEKNNKNNKILKPNFEKADFNAINTFLSNFEWEDILKDKNVEDAWIIIKDKLETAQRKYVPNKIISSTKSRPKPINTDSTLHQLLQNKRILFKTYKKYRTILTLNDYIVARNKVSMKIKQLKKDKENKIAKNIKHNPKAFYQYISSKMLKKEGVADLTKDDGELTASDTEKCEVLNDFFSSVFTTEDQDNIPDFIYDGNIPNALSSCDVCEKDFENILHNLNPNKSPGPDNFHPRFLKLVSKSIAKPVYLLFNLTLFEGKLPNDFKLAEVRPIFKKGDKTQAGNYRPVSLTSILCKVMETVVKNHLYKHLIENDLLSKHQFGFVSGRSTVTQLIVTLNEWLYNLDNNIPLDCAYMDFRKAFDTVPHKRLLNKLKGYNINGQILNWIKSFLSERHQFVKINNSVSTKHKVTSGVPQGSVLGPTLFIYFINDLPNVTNNVSVKIFADDTKVFKGIKNEDDVTNLQHAIDEMYEWTNKWLLKFNKEKRKIYCKKTTTIPKALLFH